MNASELIDKLKKQIKLNGDIDVCLVFDTFIVTPIDHVLLGCEDGANKIILFNNSELSSIENHNSDLLKSNKN